MLAEHEQEFCLCKYTWSAWLLRVQNRLEAVLSKMDGNESTHLITLTRLFPEQAQGSDRHRWRAMSAYTWLPWLVHFQNKLKALPENIGGQDYSIGPFVEFFRGGMKELTYLDVSFALSLAVTTLLWSPPQRAEICYHRSPFKSTTTGFITDLLFSLPQCAEIFKSRFIVICFNLCFVGMEFSSCDSTWYACALFFCLQCTGKVKYHFTYQLDVC